MPIQAFIFDMDGVITDTVELHYRAWERLAAEEGLTLTRALNDQMRGLTRPASMRLILAASARTVPDATAEGWMARKNVYFHALLAELTQADVLPGVREFVQEARSQGYKIGVASASQNARAVLSRLEIIHLFDVIGDGYSVVNNKPAPDPFVWVAGGLGVSPAACVVFEDAQAGIAAALAAGCFTVGLGTGGVDQAHVMLPSMAGLTVAQVLAFVEEAVRTPA